MSQSDETWNEVGEGFKKLGSLFKEHYQAQEQDGEAVSEDEVKDAIHKIGEGLKTAFATVEDAVKDPEVKDEAKQTAKSFVDAVGATFTELGDEISKWRDKRSADETPAEGIAEDVTPDE